MKALVERIRDAAIAHHQVVHPPLSLDELHQAERRIGYPLPELLRHLYIEVGNGGFGPGNGLLPLIGGKGDSSIVSMVETDDDTDQLGILEEYLPLFHWEQMSYGYVHAVEDHHVILLDDNYLQDEFDRNRPVYDQYPVLASSLEQLFNDWLAGEPLTADAYGTLSK